MKKGKERRKHDLKVLIIIAIVVVAIGALTYSLQVYYESGVAQKGIIVCDPNNPNVCLWQDHIHALVVSSVNGWGPNLPVEQGDLDKVHTHEERNILHWHSSLPYDPITQKVIDTSPLTLENSFKSIEVPLPEGAMLFVKNNGGQWGMVPEYGNYTWKDRDILYLVNDGRTQEQVLAYLQTANIELPYLGAG